MALLALTASACSGPEATAGKRVRLKAEATGHNTAAFETSTGWTVELSRAAIAFDALYYFSGESAVTDNTLDAPTPALSPWEYALNAARDLSWLGVRVAHAHPGHYQAGDTLGQLLEPGSIDLFEKRTPLGAGDGVTGTYRSGRFSIAETPVGKAKGLLDGHAALATGRAQRSADSGSDAVYFTIWADQADAARSVKGGEVNGCRFETFSVETDGTVAVQIDPGVWFDLVDFGEVDAGSEERPTEVAPDSLAQIGFALGLAQLSAYHFSFSPDR